MTCGGEAEASRRITLHCIGCGSGGWCKSVSVSQHAVQCKCRVANAGQGWEALRAQQRRPTSARWRSRSRARPPPGGCAGDRRQTPGGAAQRRYPARSFEKCVWGEERRGKKECRERRKGRKRLTSYSCCSVGVVAAGCWFSVNFGTSTSTRTCGCNSDSKRTFHEAVPDAQHCVVSKCGQRSACGLLWKAWGKGRRRDVRASEKPVKRAQGKTWFDIVVGGGGGGGGGGGCGMRHYSLTGRLGFGIA